MLDEKNDFVVALEWYINEQLRTAIEPAEYNKDAIEIVDARNHLFRNVGHVPTDEERNIYAISDLCCVDENTFDTIPNRMKLKAIARNYWNWCRAHTPILYIGYF